MTKEHINWVEEAVGYADFLELKDEGYTEENIRKWTDKKAKDFCREELENIIATNGVGELFESENIMAKLLKIDLKTN